MSKNKYVVENIERGQHVRVSNLISIIEDFDFIRYHPPRRLKRNCKRKMID